MDRDIVPKRLNLFAREGLIHAFEFLQTDHIWLRFFQPLKKVF